MKKFNTAKHKGNMISVGILIIFATIFLTVLAVPGILPNGEPISVKWPKLKKTYEVLKLNFTEISTQTQGIQYMTEWAQGADKVLTRFIPQGIIKNCGKNYTGCWVDQKIPPEAGGASLPNLDINNNFAKAILLDGTKIAFHTINTQCQGSSGFRFDICGEIYIDISNNNKKATLGSNVFGFWITKSGIIPKGTQDGLSCDKNNSDGCTSKLFGKRNYNF